jgi:tetrathionate reductase subunit A
MSGMGGGSGQPTGVVIDAGSRKPALATAARSGELWPGRPLSTSTIKVNGVACQTAFQLLYGQARAMTIADYAAEAGITPALVETLASEFTSQGRQAVADFGRGATMHTNGFYAARAIMTLNFLIGNVDWMGGYTTSGGTADYSGGNQGARYALGSWPGQPAMVPAGVPISRSGAAYEASAEYAAHMKAGTNPYPAHLPWFPFGGGQWPGMFAGMYAGYPYPAKIVLQHAANPAWSAPAIGGAGDRELPWQRLASDLGKVPLFIATDIVMSESASYADYVVPDTTYLESWEFPGAWPVVPTKVQGVRQPVIEPLTARTPGGQPMSAEQFLIDVAKAIGLSGFGANAFAGGGALNAREDYYLKMVANTAFDPSFQGWHGGMLAPVGPVPDASDQEYAAIRALRQAHPLALTQAEWRKAGYVLARGGRFEDYEAGYLPGTQSQASVMSQVGAFLLDTGVERFARAPGQVTPARLRASYSAAVQLPVGAPANPPWMAYQYGQGGVACQIYNPAVAMARNSMTGEMFHGTACYTPVADLRGQPFAEHGPGSGFPFLLTTHKTTVLSHSQSIADPWLTELMPEGFIEMSPADAARLGLRSGDLARVWSATLPRERGIVGRVRLLPGVRPGVIAFPHGYGHWQAGAAGITVDGKFLAGDEARAVPVRLNAVCRLETAIAAPDGWSVGCMDPVTGGQAYFDTRVAVERA